jgi:hypothetical protein
MEYQIELIGLTKILTISCQRGSQNKKMEVLLLNK